MSLDLSFEGGLACVTVLGTALALATTRLAPDLVVVAALSFLILAGVLSPEAALAGGANPGLATVAVLYVVVSGLLETGAVAPLGEKVLGRGHSVPRVQLRLMLPVMALSAFLNNTPVVAMLVPTVQAWARRHRFPVSRLMIPLSYAAILGGTCTLIGTSTNLIVGGLVAQRPGAVPIGFFEIAWIGVPSAIAGALMLIGASRWLLPDRRPALLEPEDPKQYALEMLVDPASSLVGRSIEGAGLRHLSGVYLAEIEREGSLLPAVAPTERLRGGDRLVFVGRVDSVLDVYKIRGLVPAPDQVFKLDSPRPERRLIEAVVSPTCPLVGSSIRQGEFRTRYEAVVIAVARGGERLHGKIGDIVLQPGDTLLVEARPAFVALHRASRDFLLVSEVDGSGPPRHERAGVAVAVVVAMVLAAALLGVPMLTCALCAAGVLLATRCTSVEAARRSIDWPVLTVIGAALGLGRALEDTGAAAALARAWLTLAGESPWVALLAVYAITSLLTEVITNNAAAVLIFPIAEATAESLGVSFRPFVFAIMLAASASFATPIGYQTNLMVYGPGGYRFSDFLRVGIPLNLLCAAVAAGAIPVLWPF